MTDPLAGKNTSQFLSQFGFGFGWLIHHIRPPHVIIRGLLTRGNPGTVMIPQYRVNKTKQHTPRCAVRWSVESATRMGVPVCAALFYLTDIGESLRSQGFLESEPRGTHPRRNRRHLPSPCPPFNNLGCPDPHPSLTTLVTLHLLLLGL